MNVQGRVTRTLLSRGVVALAAAMFLVACTSSSEPQQEMVTSPPPGTQPAASAFPLSTSDWTPDDGSEDALLDATLHLDGRCLLAGPARYPTVVVWPKGFTASEPYDGIVAVANADGTAVAFSGQRIKAGGGYSEITSWITPQCAGKYDAVFVVQESMPGQQSPNPPSKEASLLDGLATSPEQLEGKWYASELMGKDVKPREDERIPVPYLLFSLSPTQTPTPWTWSTNDDCNFTAGQYTVLPDGTFNAQDGVSTLVGCSRVWSMHGANLQALTDADQAVLLPSDFDTADAVDRLVLLRAGEIVAVYLAGPRNDPLDTIVPGNQTP